MNRTLVLIGGLPGAGKTTLGHQLAQQKNGAVIDPDITRYAIARGILQTAGRADDARLPDTIAPIGVSDLSGVVFNDDGEHPWFYHSAVTILTVAAMIDQARAAFETHTHVIVPSAFVTAASRQKFVALGQAMDARIIKIWLEADERILEGRLRDRLAAHPEAPGLHALHKAREAYDPLGQEDWVRVDARGNPDDLCLDVVKEI